MSYENGLLSSEKVAIIADRLSRKALKKYIDALRQEEEKHIVHIESARELATETKDILEKRFPKKMLHYHTNTELLSGIQIRDGDLMYELTMQNILGNIASYLGHTYDR